jgi:hypothetical protein
VAFTISEIHLSLVPVYVREHHEKDKIMEVNMDFLCMRKKIEK